MKRKLLNRTVLCLAFTLTFLTGAFNAQAQNASFPSVDAIQTEADKQEAGTIRPTLIHAGDELSGNEIHYLPPLNQEQVNFISSAVDPPLIGIVRDLPEQISFALDQTSALSVTSKTLSGGRLFKVNNDTLSWTTQIRADQAEEIRVNFSEGFFPEGVKVNIFSRDNYAFHQPELSGRIGDHGFYTTTVFADYLTIQVIIPLSSLKERLYFTIPKIVHVHHRPPAEAPNATCYEDVNCSYANSYVNIGVLKSAVAQIGFVVGGGYGICSGSLLNDIRATDNQPFFLTAAHCFNTQASAASLEAKFDYYSTSCNGPTNTNYILVNGANLLATNSQTDFTLVLLQNNPGGFRWYLGWNAGSVANDETLHSVHHPDGLPQKYQRMLNKTAPDFSCGGFSTANFHYTRTVGGQEIPGSSGGNVVLPSGQVVGQLYGWCYLPSADRCNYSTYYNMWGRFDVSYANNNLQYWLYNGGAIASIYVPTTSLNFGTKSVGSYSYMNVTVYNNGFVPNYLNIEAAGSITGTDASQFTITGPTSLYLAPNTSGTFTVRFNPTSSGTKTAQLNITHNADNALSPIVVSLTGVADPCSDVISLGAGGFANLKTFSKSGTGAWYNTSVNACGYFSPGNEQIYSFVAPYTGYYSIEVTSTNSTWVDYLWRTGGCAESGWTCIDDVFNPGTYGSMYWTAGTNYYILVDDENSSLSTHSFYIYFSPCLNVTPIAGTGVANEVTYTGGGYGAWNTGSAGSCGYFCPGIEHVYSFVAPYTGFYNITVSGASQYYVDYFWSTGCSSTGWTCIDDISGPGTYGNMFWTSGTTYYILLDDEDNIAGTQSFYINAPEPCNNIFPIACGAINYFNGSGQGVWDMDPCWWSPGYEQIYSIVAPFTGNYSIRVHSTGNTWVDYAWKEGSCSEGDWNCINYVYYPGQYGSMSWIAGHTYLIRLDDEDTDLSTHTFSIVCPTVCQDCGTYDFLVTPQLDWQTHSSSVAAYGCKMYRFDGWAGYPVTFKTGCGDGASADFDTYLEIFDETCTLLASNNDGCGLQSALSFNPPSGYAFYYLKVSGNMGAAGNYTLAYNYCYYAPAQPVEIFGPATVVKFVPTSFSIDPVPYATSYTWSYSGIGTITGSGTSIFLDAESSGVLSVTANNACGMSAATLKEIYAVPDEIWLQWGTLFPGYWCFDAATTIEVAGTGLPLIVPNGSSMELVAGQKILIHPGFTVSLGGYLLARIDDDGTFCNFTPAKESGLTTIGLTAAESQSSVVSKDQFFKVFPNPTSGAFTLELSDEPAGNKVRVQCYNLMGSLIMDKTLDAGRTHWFTLENQAPGMYIIKVTGNGMNGMSKIIRQ